MPWFKPVPVGRQAPAQRCDLRRGDGEAAAEFVFDDIGGQDLDAGKRRHQQPPPRRLQIVGQIGQGVLAARTLEDRGRPLAHDHGFGRRGRTAIGRLVPDAGLAERPPDIDDMRRLDHQDRQQRLQRGHKIGLRPDQNIADPGHRAVEQRLPGRLAVILRLVERVIAGAERRRHDAQRRSGHRAEGAAGAEQLIGQPGSGGRAGVAGIDLPLECRAVHHTRISRVPS